MKQEDEKLFAAVKKGDLQRARASIEAGANVNARDNWLRTPLHWAAVSGNTVIAQALIEARAVINVQDNGQDTPLHIAARLGHTDIARRLIDSGADVNARDTGNRTPLEWALVMEDTADMVALLKDAARKPAIHADRVSKRRGDDQERTR